ncbi:hybrid sensor histidine kinase/response regulator [Agrobacterium vaccinii]|uniref:hybrid sensor histidine kinase/response regulator n=1 Tax=Agrobacterium vaccinii TaxID=2735528 RepID=UPI001E41B0FC|nr:ATP-binding protein [Agrobacterium vaccinii]
MKVFDDFDWSVTPIGPKEQWSVALRTTYDLITASGFGMCAAWGPEGTFLYNEPYAEFLGDRHPAALGQPIAQVWPEIWDDIKPLVNRAMAGETIRLENMHLTMTRNGYEEDTYWTFSYSPLRDGDVVSGFLNVAHDTTALVVAQNRDRVNAERVQLALGAGAIIGTWFWDLPTDRFTIDAAFADSFGLDQALGRTGLPLEQIIATVHPEDRDGLIGAINEVIARGGAYAHQYRVRRRDGKYYWIEANGRVDFAEDGTPSSFPGVLIDVEERRAVEAERDRAISMLRALNDGLEQRVSERTSELLKAQDALRQSQKMEAVGQLTGGLAHDFNNLLAGISGSLELMERRLSQGRGNELDRYLSAAQGAVKRAAALTHRLLAFSRRQTLDPKPTDIDRLIAGLEDLIKRTVGPAVDIEVVEASGTWKTLVDPSQLENAVLNLCINARDAMPNGGRITIRTENTRLDARGADESGLPEGEYVCLRITDTGTGIPADVLDKVFEPFFTTKPLGQGTGLGLSMIYGFAQQSGGKVEISSEQNAGTTVSIFLPHHILDGEIEDERIDTRTPGGARAQETVLVVDDEPTVRMLISDVLQEFGYTVIEAADSATGLKILQSDVGIDLLVSDVGLPGGMDGRQMADAARQSRPGLKVLFVTGYAENAAVRDGKLDPGMAVLTKPFAVETLAAQVRELIE